MTKRAVVRPRISGRRLIVVAALGLLAAGALSACRSEPGTAAFVGDTRITDAQVDSQMNEIKAQNVSADTARSQIVVDLVFNQLAQKYAAEKGITLSQPTPDTMASVASTLGLGSKDSVLTTIADAATWQNDLLTQAPTVTPTDAELMSIYQKAVDAGLAQGGQFDQQKATIAQVQGLGQSLGLERELTAAVTHYNVSISPRYQPSCAVAPCDPPQLSLLKLGDSTSGVSFDAVSVAFGSAVKSPDVIDIPNPVQPAPTQPLQVPGPPQPGS